MKKYLLILFSYAGLEKMDEFIFNKLEKGDKLILNAVMLKAVPKLVNHLTSDVGFLGDKVASDVEESVVEIYYDNAKDYMESLEKKAEAEGINIEKTLIKKHQIDKLKAEIKSCKADSIIINFSNNEYVSDQVKETEIKDWLEKIDLEQYIFHDGKLY